MDIPKPLMPPYDVRAWQKKPFAVRMKMVCQAWAIQGYGTPWPIYLVYLVKVALYVGAWCFFCSFTPGLGNPRAIASWWAAPAAFQKAILWSMAFEGLGLGCGSGPLTGRYFPPMGGALYFLRPGTTKLPLFPGLPLLGGDRRTLLDVALYVAHYAFLGRVLLAPALTPALIYRGYPEDLRPSSLTHAMAHVGTVVEYAFPTALLLGDGGTTTRVALVTMLLFHVFITSSIPMGVPIEWNLVMVYGAFFLFGVHADVSVVHLASPLLLGFLVVACFLVQMIGNLAPSRVSFLCAMRYYAGNWAYSVWLFKGQSSRKLDTHLTKSAPRVQEQLAKFYDEETTIALLSKIMAFRAMHTHGRPLQLLLPRAVSDLDAYEYVDGEIIAGVVLGWNFGDGHLHQMQLLRAVQRQCGFAEGELRCIFVESQPLGGSSLSWTIADAATGIRETGEIQVREIEALQPFPPQPS